MKGYGGRGGPTHPHFLVELKAPSCRHALVVWGCQPLLGFRRWRSQLPKTRNIVTQQLGKVVVHVVMTSDNGTLTLSLLDVVVIIKTFLYMHLVVKLTMTKLVIYWTRLSFS